MDRTGRSGSSARLRAATRCSPRWWPRSRTRDESAQVALIARSSRSRRPRRARRPAHRGLGRRTSRRRARRADAGRDRALRCRQRRLPRAVRLSVRDLRAREHQSIDPRGLGERGENDARGRDRNGAGRDREDRPLAHRRRRDLMQAYVLDWLELTRSLVPSHRRHRMDRRVVLLRVARRQPQPSGDRGRTAARHRRRAVGRARRRLLPQQEVSDRPGRRAAQQPSALVLLGSLLDVALRHGDARDRVLGRRVDVPDRQVRAGPHARPRRSAISIGSIVVGWFVYDALCRIFEKNEFVLWTAIGVFLLLADWGLFHVFGAARGVHPRRRDRRHDHGVERLLHHHSGAAQGRRATARGSRCPMRGRASSASSARCRTRTSRCPCCSS